MTREHLELNVAAECERGAHALTAAQQLLQLKLFYAAATQAYFAAFHFARALCLTAGEEPKSHQGVAHLLSLHFVKTGVLPAETSREFALLQRYRESSDYDAAFVLDEAGAAQALTKAEAFTRLASTQLVSLGLLKK